MVVIGGGLIMKTKILSKNNKGTVKTVVFIREWSYYRGLKTDSTVTFWASSSTHIYIFVQLDIFHTILNEDDFTYKFLLKFNFLSLFIFNIYHYLSKISIFIQVSAYLII